MQRLLVRVYRDPFRRHSATTILEHDLIGHNNGNLLFSDAAVKALATSSAEITAWPAQRMSRHIDEFEERFDHLVLPLANVLRAGFAPRLRALTEIVRRVDLPVTVLGIGAQGTVEGDFSSLASMREDVCDFVAAVLDRSPSIGVRGEMTAGYLARLGFSDVEVIGCPSMFTFGHDLPATRIPAGQGPARIAVNLNRVLPVPTGLVESLLAGHHDVVYFPQDLNDLRAMSWGRGAPGADEPGVDGPLMDNARFHLDSETWVDDLATFDLSWGTRIHGNVAAVLAGTAAVVVVHDSRTRELAEHFELPRVRLDALGESFDLEALVQDQDFAATGAGHAPRFDRFASFLGSHGLRHVWEEGSSSSWASRRDAVPLTQPVVVEGGRPVDPRSQMAWMRRQVLEEKRRTRERMDRQSERLRSQRQKISDQRTSLGRATREVEQLRERLDRVESRLAQLERRPVARLRTAAARLRRAAAPHEASGRGRAGARPDNTGWTRGVSQRWPRSWSRPPGGPES